jgi:hypothetical protein
MNASLSALQTKRAATCVDISGVGNNGLNGGHSKIDAIDRAARLAAIPAGESPANRRSPVTVVVISSDGKDDRAVESLEVKASGGRETGRPRPRNLAGRSGSEPVKPRNASPAWNGLRECRECRECRAVGQSAKAMSASKSWNISVSERDVGGTMHLMQLALNRRGYGGQASGPSILDPNRQ